MKFEHEVVCQYRYYSEYLKGLFPLSTNVDMLLFLLGEKQNLRTQFIDYEKFPQFELWCKTTAKYFEIDNQYYLYLAVHEESLKKMVAVDHSLDAHAEELGCLLGYPACCCEKIAEVGEDGIDEFETKIANRTFKGHFKLINPYAYREGRAFISHVPCSTNCLSSLKQAQVIANFILANQGEPIFNPWLDELSKINYNEKLLEK